MPTVNYLADKLNLIGNSIDCTELTTNKFEMRERLKKSGLPIPKYQLVQKKSDVNFDVLSFPLIVKPIDRSGSRGILKVSSIDELKSGIIEATDVSFTDKILIEEFIEGDEYSIESLSQDGIHEILQITEKFTTGSPNFIEHAHLSPARINEKLKSRISKIVKESLDSLNVYNGASHSEIKVSNNNEIKIIEIAARMGGDFIGSDMVEISTGFDYVESVIRVALGQNIEYITLKNKENAIVKFIFDKEDVKKLKEVERKYPELIKEMHINQKVERVNDSSSRNGYCILKITDNDKLSNVLEILDMHKKNKE